MSITTHERPGVYSSYDASSVVGAAGAGRTVGIVGLSSAGTEGSAIFSAVVRRRMAYSGRTGWPH